MQYDENAEKYGYEGEMTLLKCDELNAYKGDVYIPVYGSIADAQVYIKKDVDAAIAELKDVIHELQVDLEGAKATAYADSVDAGMRERMLKRALWIARAERAKEKQQLFNFSLGYEKLCIDGFYDPYSGRRELSPKQWIKIFNKVEVKCLKKAEEYK
jgi:hypothetical protein